MNYQLAFIDEFGNNGLDFEKPDVSTHFIVTAIIVDEEKLNLIEEKLEIVRKKHFQTGEIKSKSIGDNDKRRIEILNDISTIDFHLFASIVDKRELKTKGFTYKQSFYKFLHALVDRELFRIYPNIKIVADEHGGDEFKKSFIKYIESNHVSDLFNQKFNLTNSKSNLLVQLADFISGTLSRCYETTKLSDRRNEILIALKSKILEIRNWPIQNRNYSYDPTVFKDFDNSISELSVSIAKDFIAVNRQHKVD
jgi:hypothetical protein